MIEVDPIPNSHFGANSQLWRLSQGSCHIWSSLIVWLIATVVDQPVIQFHLFSAYIGWCGLHGALPFRVIALILLIATAFHTRVRIQSGSSADILITLCGFLPSSWVYPSTVCPTVIMLVAYAVTCWRDCRTLIACSYRPFECEQNTKSCLWFDESHG